MSYRNSDVPMSSLIGQVVTLHGTAYNAKAGATIVTDANQVVYISGLEAWDNAAYGREVTVEGRLDQRRIYPKPFIDEQGAISQGMEGEPFVIELTHLEIDGR